MKRTCVIAFVVCLWPGVASAGGPANNRPVENLSDAYAHLNAIETIAEQGLCTEWAGAALDAGWPTDLLPKLLFVVHRESRCIPTACSTPDRPDLRRCRDWGLTQINDYSWKRTIRNQGLEMEQMWDPYQNLRFAYWLYNYSLQSTGCGWTPWSLRCR